MYDDAKGRKWEMLRLVVLLQRGEEQFYEDLYLDFLTMYDFWYISLEKMKRVLSWEWYYVVCLRLYSNIKAISRLCWMLFSASAEFLRREAGYLSSYYSS